LLDGGWWPRSIDPVAELPGLVLAIDELHGPVTRLLLGADSWDPHPRRLRVAGRVLRLGYFSSQPADLLTALCDNGERVDLLVVPPDTPTDTARTAMAFAATANNRIHAEDIVLASYSDSPPEETWETDGGHLTATTYPGLRLIRSPEPTVQGGRLP